MEGIEDFAADLFGSTENISYIYTEQAYVRAKTRKIVIII